MARRRMVLRTRQRRYRDVNERRLAILHRAYGQRGERPSEAEQKRLDALNWLMSWHEYPETWYLWRNVRRSREQLERDKARFAELMDEVNHLLETEKGVGNE